MASKMQAFDFVDGGQTYTCRIEAPRSGGRDDAWWWFGVTGDRSRYAPFRAEEDDTEASVRSRIVAYYGERVARRGWTSHQDRAAVRGLST